MSENKSKLERRDFLKLGGAGIAASALSAGCAAVAVEQKKPAPIVQAPAPVAKPDGHPDGSPRRKLGRTGIEVPVVSMGV
ncbi:MAG TPA: twin-arginine translocation signal domain-containing protein, partial [Polyangia bacterium]